MARRRRNKAPGEAKDEHKFFARIPNDVYDDLVAQAEHDERSINGELVFGIKQWLDSLSEPADEER